MSNTKNKRLPNDLSVKKFLGVYKKKPNKRHTLKLSLVSSNEKLVS